jgi:PleD family two-component response regulator
MMIIHRLDGCGKAVEKQFNASLTIRESGLALREGQQVFASLFEDCRMVQCLLINRDPGERARLAQLLSGLGLTLTERALAGEGVAVCNDNTPDVVLMQAEGQDMEAQDFVRRVRRSPRAKKPVVILFSGAADTEVIGQSILSGAADFIMLPLDRDLLAFKLRQAGIKVS